MSLIPDPQVDTFISEHPEWSRVDKELTRTFVFKNFSESMGFIVRVGIEAEKVDHHPDIDIRWNKVTLTLSTHSEGGLTSLDLNLADTAESLI